MDKEKLSETVSRAKAGSPAAYEELLKAYQSRLFGYFFRATGSHHDAEDLLGELILRLVRNLHNYDEKGRFEAWLFRMAANLIRDRIRKRKARPSTYSLSAGEDDGGAFGDELPAAQPDVDAAVLSEELSVELHEALEQLDEVTREMILLRHFGEMSFKEIASTFRCPLGTSLAKIHRGLKSLRRIMKDSEGV